MKTILPLTFFIAITLTILLGSAPIHADSTKLFNFDSPHRIPGRYLVSLKSRTIVAEIARLASANTVAAAASAQRKKASSSSPPSPGESIEDVNLAIAATHLVAPLHGKVFNYWNSGEEHQVFAVELDEAAAIKLSDDPRVSAVVAERIVYAD